MGEAVLRVLMVKQDVEALGGSERYLLRSASALLSLGHSVYLAHGGGPSQNTAPFSGVISVPELFERDRFIERKSVRDSYRALRSFIEEEQVEVIHLNWMLRTAVMHRLVKHVPVVMTPHNASCPNKSRFLWKERLPCHREIGVGCLSGYFNHGCGHLGNGEPFGLPGFLRAMVEDRRSRAAIARCHRIIAGSKWMADYLAATGTSADKIRVVEPPIAAVAEPAGLPAADPPLVTFVGRLVGFKGADHLLKASQRLGIDHRLAIAGDGPDLQALMALAAELGISDRVDFLGRMDTAELESL
ncbi:MAG: hypothetical protein QOJ19_408, partial [Acidimicrobiia bacterium]|nr:hypothetical protein [Acidimicrobiia bacterium]